MAGNDGVRAFVVFSEAAGQAAKLGETGPDHGPEHQVGRGRCLRGPAFSEGSPGKSRASLWLPGTVSSQASLWLVGGVCPGCSGLMRPFPAGGAVEPSYPLATHSLSTIRSKPTLPQIEYLQNCFVFCPFPHLVRPHLFLCTDNMLLGTQHI